MVLSQMSAPRRAILRMTSSGSLFGKISVWPASLRPPIAPFSPPWKEKPAVIFVASVPTRHWSSGLATTRITKSKKHTISSMTLHHGSNPHSQHVMSMSTCFPRSLDKRIQEPSTIHHRLGVLARRPQTLQLVTSTSGTYGTVQSSRIRKHLTCQGDL